MDKVMLSEIKMGLGNAFYTLSPNYFIVTSYFVYRVDRDINKNLNWKKTRHKDNKK